MPNPSFLRWILALVACLASAPAALAGPPPKKAVKPVPVWVMPVRMKGEGLDPALAQTLGKAMIDELKALSVFDVLAGKDIKAKTKALKAKKILVAGCEEKKGCVQAVGRTLGATLFFHMQIGKAQEGITVTMRTYDVKTGKMLRQAVERADERPEDLERAARWAARQVSSPVVTSVLKAKGRLIVTSSEGGANLYLNGKSFGTNMSKPFKVSAGVFDVVVKKEGFEPFHDVVVVKPDEERTVEAKLVAVDRRAAPAPGDSGAKPADGVAVAPGEDRPGEVKPADKPKDELPAWAVFDRGKPADKPADKQADKPADKPKVVADKPKVVADKPYLPPDKKEEREGDEDTPVYEAWWFWTVIGVVVVGGGLGLGLGLTMGGEGGGETGSALLTWQ